MQQVKHVEENFGHPYGPIWFKWFICTCAER